MVFYRKSITHAQCGIAPMTLGKKAPATCHLQQFRTNSFAK
jgi:hypothetical protein